MSALCQGSLARQQNINCFQLAELPSLSPCCGQSEASLVEQSTFTVATAPIYLCSMVKITPTSEVKLAVPAAQDEG
ncbi:hypothetical protein NQZ68_035600 [Dissostichus eleginoides]|nr:hypothetical protein NQZ68_035600 [Dissostichus eleginoides]